jgi:hypothetical protein
MQSKPFTLGCKVATIIAFLRKFLRPQYIDFGCGPSI